METNLKLTFTAVAGRSGSNYLTLLINKYAKNCFSECEAPDLIHKGSGFTGSLSRSFQRKWIVTEEMLGRGKALEWYEQNKQHPLRLTLQQEQLQIVFLSIHPKPPMLADL